MEVWKLVLLGMVIGSNNLAVAFAIGALDTKAFWWRIIVIFGVFEFVIPLVGILIGQEFSTFIASFASYLGGGILLLFGVFMLYKSFQPTKKEDSFLLNKVKSWSGIITLSASLSLDNLLVGFSIGLQNYHPLTTSSVIAISSILFTIVGLNSGKYLKHQYRKPTDIFSAFLLIALGLASLLEWI